MLRIVVVSSIMVFAAVTGIAQDLEADRVECERNHNALIEPFHALPELNWSCYFELLGDPGSKRVRHYYADGGNGQVEVVVREGLLAGAWRWPRNAGSALKYGEFRATFGGRNWTMWHGDRDADFQKEEEAVKRLEGHECLFAESIRGNSLQQFVYCSASPSLLADPNRAPYDPEIIQVIMRNGGLLPSDL